MKYLFVGDTHGDLDFVRQVASIAADYSAEIIQVGDWGFMWPGRDTYLQLDDILNKLGVTMRFIDGNHDDHPRLQNKWVNLPNLIYQPRGSVHEDKDGTRFLFMGGAPSIDQAFRTPGKSWWPEEDITDEQMEIALAHEKINVIVTHDAPGFPPGYGPKGEDTFRVRATKSQDNILKLMTRYSPQLLIHGHWHCRYKQDNIIGLDCNSAKLNEAYYFWPGP